VAIAIPIYGAVTDRAEEGACQANRRMIDGAKMMYQAADEEGAWPDDYIDGGMPSCPSGGTYSNDGGTDSGQTACSEHTDPY